MTFISEVGFRSIKLLDIGYVTVIYFSVGMILAKLFDIIYGEFDEKREAKRPFFLRGLELLGMMWLSGIVIYFVRNLVELIPFPLEGVFGFKHLKLKELKGAAVFTFVFLYFQAHLRGKMNSFYSELKF